MTTPTELKECVECYRPMDATKASTCCDCAARHQPQPSESVEEAAKACAERNCDSKHEHQRAIDFFLSGYSHAQSDRAKVLDRIINLAWKDAWHDGHKKCAVVPMFRLEQIINDLKKR